MVAGCWLGILRRGRVVPGESARLLQPGTQASSEICGVELRLVCSHSATPNHYIRHMRTRGHIVIAGESALDIWKHVDPSSRNAPTRTDRNVLADARVSKSLVEDLAVRSYLPPKSTLTVVVGSQSRWARVDGVACRVCNARLPRGAFYHLGPDTYVVSPELALAQQSTTLSVPQIADIAMQLCGNYYVESTTGQIMQRTRPATTPRRVANFVQQAAGMSGVGMLRMALPWILPKAESPMEIKTMLLLCLPYRMGGYGCPLPEFNPVIDPKGNSVYVNQSHFRVDLCWARERTIVEYDGKESHADAHRDKRRTNDLEGMGWKVFVLTASDLYDENRFGRFARKVARSLNHRLRPSRGWEIKQMVLRAELGMPSLAQRAPINRDDATG